MLWTQVSTLKPHEISRHTKAGFVGMLVPSYARGATQSDKNLVLWQWRTGPSVHVTIIGD